MLADIDGKEKRRKFTYLKDACEWLDENQLYEEFIRFRTKSDLHAWILARKSLSDDTIEYFRQAWTIFYATYGPTWFWEMFGHNELYDVPKINPYPSKKYK